MLTESGGGGGGTGSMSVKIDHAALAGAIEKLSTLASSIDTQRNRVSSGTPVATPSMGTLAPHAAWLRDQEPYLQGLHDIAVLLATEGGSATATFSVGTDLEDIKEMLGRTLADNAGMGNPNDPESSEAYLELFERWQFDPATMAAFQGQLGPEGTLRTLSMWADAPVDSANGEPPSAVQAALVAAMRRSLVTANQPGGFTPSESVDFAHGLVDAATIDPEDYFGRGPYNPSGALTYLLYDQKFSDRFITTIADDLDQYERQDNDGAGGLWSNRPEQDVFFGDYMEPGTYDPYAGNMDPMTGVMSALSHNPEAALEWFQNDDAGDGESTRAQYYIQERNWDRDAYKSITQVLDAATTDEALLNGTADQQHDAAELASATVEFLSRRENVDELPEIMSRWPEHGAAENLSHILGTYMNGVVPGLDNEDASVGAHGNRPAFDKDSLQKISLAAMSTDQGLAELTNGLNNYRALHLGELADNLAADDTADNRTLLRDGVQTDARLQGFFLNALGDDEIRSAEARDAATRAMVGHLTDVVDLVPVPGVSKLDGVAQEAVNMTINTVKGEAYDSFADSIAHEGEDTRNEFEGTAFETSIREQFTLAQLLDERGLSANPGQLHAAYPGGSPITYEEYAALDTAEQDQVELELFGPDGVGGVYNRQDYSEAFESEFSDYFD